MTDSSTPPPRSLKRKIAYLAVVLVVFLVVVEVVLRVFGFQPGFVGAYPWEYLAMKPVEELVETPEYYVNEEGIFRANPEFVHESYAILNADGFRSIPFDTHAVAGKRRILWIGDSFTWGGSAEPLTESFVDLTARETGWACYNAGIPGAGPSHYAKTGEKYIPLLRPDDVVVVCYMANDVLYEYQPVGPNQNPFHITNAGWMAAYMDGLYLETPQIAYDYYIRKFSIPDQDEKLMNRVCSWTSLSTRLWHLIAWIGWVDRYDAELQTELNAYEASKLTNPVTEEYLLKIRAASDAVGANFHLFVIQVHSHLAENIEETHPGLFVELDYQFCPELTRGDYHEWPNGHLKNSGHQKFADFLVRELSE